MYLIEIEMMLNDIEKELERDIDSFSIGQRLDLIGDILDAEYDFDNEEICWDDAAYSVIQRVMALKDYRFITPSCKALYDLSANEANMEITVMEQDDTFTIDIKNQQTGEVIEALVNIPASSFKVVD